MTKIAPAVLEDIQRQVDSVEIINEDEVNQGTKNNIGDQEDSTPSIPNIQESSETKPGRNS